MSDGMLERESLYDPTPPKSPLRDFQPDLGAEDYEFPSLDDLDPVKAGQLWSAIEMEAAEANRRAARLKERKQVAKALTIAAIDASGQTGARVPLPNGREVNLTPYTQDHYSVKDQAEFEDWAKDQAERFWDETPRFREGVFQDHMRGLEQRGEPLPPGVVRWRDTKISRTAVPQRRKK
jgi:hypothetical protein